MAGPSIAEILGVAAVATLVLVGSLLAVAEASISRMGRTRAAALRREGRRHAARLEAIERDPAPFLTAIYLAVMFVQNGSAILVAMLAERRTGDLGVTLVSVVFTLGYFLVVEAMSKTFGILHSDRAALAVAPFVWGLGRALAGPTRLLIGISNLLLPGKGLAHGPFVSEDDIRSMVDAGHEEGVIEASEKEMIESVFELGDLVVRDLMIPRPDVVAIEIETPLRDAHARVVHHGLTRLPACRGDLDHTEGIVHAKDVLGAVLDERRDAHLEDFLRPVHFVPESQRAVRLLRDMRKEHFHLALVVDEYGSVSGLVTLDDLVGKLVGRIFEEHEEVERDIEPLGDGAYRVDASVSIMELNQLLGTDLARDRWNTVGGLMFGLLGTIPAPGQSVSEGGHRFTAEKVGGRRVTTVLVTREPSHG
jgi:CBS domain containing-hemolysin-like protein